MTKTFRRIFILVAVIVILFFLATETSLFPSLKNVFQPKKVVVDETPLMVAEIKNIAQLMTVEAYNEVVVDSTRFPFGMPPRVFKAIPGNPLRFLGASQLVLIVKGKLVAGVDLKTLNKNNIQVRSDSLFIQLPRAVVLDVITNPSDVETFIERGDWNEAAATVLKIRARNRLVQQAIAQGALQQADAKARQLIYGLFKNAGYKSVIVSTAIQINNLPGK